MQGKSKISLILVYCVFALFIIFFFIPSLWLFLAVFSEKAEAFVGIPKKLTLTNFVKLFTDYNFSVPLCNSLFVSSVTTVLVILIVSMGAYSLSRWKSSFKDPLLYSILLLRIIPISATMVPLYSLMRILALRNTYLGLILVYTAIQLPFSLWIMKQFFDTVPAQLEEAASLDGASYFRTLFSIILPNAKVGLMVIACLAFRAAWSESVLVLVLIDSEELRTIPRAFYETIRTMGGYTEIRYEAIATMGLLFLIPLLVIFYLGNKYFTKGMLGGTFK